MVLLSFSILLTGNMSGKTKGVSSRVQQQFPKALPMWCAAHRLNRRCIVQTCTIPEVRNIMSTADQVVCTFKLNISMSLKQK